MTNKEKAQAFLKSVASGKVREAYEHFISANFIHHNQYFKGDRKSLMEAMLWASTENPNKVMTIKKTFEDGNNVITFSHVKQHPDDVGGAVVHIFRFENGKVAELWDLGQPIEQDSPNEYGVF